MQRCLLNCHAMMLVVVGLRHGIRIPSSRFSTDSLTQLHTYHTGQGCLNKYNVTELMLFVMA